MLKVTNLPEPQFLETEQQARHFLGDLDKRDIFAIDTETTGLNIVRDIPLYLSFAFEGCRAAVSGKFISLFTPVLEDRSKIHVAHNGKYDQNMLQNIGISMRHIHDTLVMSRMENSERISHKLKPLTSSLFPPGDPRYVDYRSPFVGKVHNIMDFVALYGEKAGADYASLDAWNTWNVYHHLKQLLQDKPAVDDLSLWDLFVSEEVPYTEVLYNCERRGILMDFDHLEKASKKAKQTLEKLSGRFMKNCGRVLNLRSPKQVSDLFHNYLGYKPVKLTKKGQAPSVDDDALSIWAAQGNELAKILREFRKIDKLNGTYLEGLMDRADAAGRIHPTLNQYAAATGRLTSNDPNGQNIPRPETDEFKIRSAFKASPRMLMLDSDYDQLELVLSADFAEEQGMLKALREGKDLHSMTTSEITGIAYEEIVAAKKHSSKLKKGEELTEREAFLLEQRYKFKTIGFSLNYGAGPKRLSQELECSLKEAKKDIERYFSVRPGLKRLAEEYAQVLKEQGFIQTLSGRWRTLSLATSSDYKIAGSVAKDGLSSVIQGTAADVTRLAMLYCSRSPLLKELGVEMLLQIHDEILFECPEESTKWAMPEIKKLMEQPYNDILNVKLNADPGFGPNWTTAKG